VYFALHIARLTGQTGGQARNDDTIFPGLAFFVSEIFFIGETH